MANEDEYDGNTWLLDSELSRNDGVITQSVTLASEAALLGTHASCYQSKARFPGSFTE